MNSTARDTVVRLRNVRPADVSRQLSDAVNAVTSQVVDGLQVARDRAQGAAKSTDQFVRANPWIAVGAVALAGIAAGILVTLTARRPRRKPGNELSSEFGGG